MDQYFVTLKLKNGADLIGIIRDEDNESVTIANPIEISVDPIHGFYAKSWLLLAASDSAKISKSDVLVFDQASEKAIDQYNEFMKHIGKEHLREDNDFSDYAEPTLEDDFSNDSEITLEDMLMSKFATKH